MIQTTGCQINNIQLKTLQGFGNDVASFGANCIVYDDRLNLILNYDGGRFISDYEAIAACGKHLLDGSSNDIQKLGESEQIVAATINIADDSRIVVVIDCQQPEPKASFDRRLSLPKVMCQMLKMFRDSFVNAIRFNQQTEMVSNELSQTYEELMLLYKMSSNMKMNRSDSNYLQMACDSLTELVNVEGIAIFIEKRIGESKRLTLTAGTGLIAIDHKHENMHDVLFERLMSELAGGSDALLDSEVDSPFKYEWYGRVKNIIAVPLHGKDSVIGMMVATNRLDKADFDSIDVKLFNSVANECAVFIQNQNLFKDLKELFIGSLKALTNSIDAKDQYTRGHSERVALISKWLAEKYAQQTGDFTADDVQKIYLSGLLHDIGKIGISEAVLCKEGKLTDEEYEQIKKHPSIGAAILSDIRQMVDIVPGVLCHHERFDGRGYPKGLKGNDIPIAGKIVMIADTFDAMTSKRTYRNALSVETALQEIQAGLGGQFDPEMGSLFLNSDIDRLWQMIQDEDIENYYSEGFGDYGTIAVGALLK